MIAQNYSILKLQILTHSKEDKVFLVAFSDAIVHPRTMMIHLPNAPSTNAETIKELFLVIYSKPPILGPNTRKKKLDSKHISSIQSYIVF